MFLFIAELFDDKNNINNNDLNDVRHFDFLLNLHIY